MNLRPNIVLTALGLVFGLLTVLFCGICRDPEFYEPSIFVKHRPTFKLHFYSPTGEQDIIDLNERGKEEEIAFQEFVVNQKVYTDNLDKLWFLPPILIQLTLTFLFLATTVRTHINSMRVTYHFIINIIPSTLIVTLMLFFEGALQLTGLAGLLIITNIWTIRLTKRKSAQL